MENEGWIKLHRKIRKSWIYQDPEYLKAWLTILLEINHDPGKVLIKGTLFSFKAGESLKSLDTWGKLFGRWSKWRVKRFFTLLRNEQMITTNNEHKTLRLSVCNWVNYQINRNTDQPTDATPTQRTPTIDKNDKNDKNEKNIKPLWKENSEEGYQEYLKIAEAAFDRFYNDIEWIAHQKEFYPGMSIRKSMDKMWENYWGKPAGWKKKRSSKTTEINWEQTIINGLSMSMNKVWLSKDEYDQEQFEIEQWRKSNA